MLEALTEHRPPPENVVFFVVVLYPKYAADLLPKGYHFFL